MTSQRNSDGPQQHSADEKQQQPSAGRFVVGATIVFLLAGTLVYTMIFLEESEPQSTVGADDSSAPATTESQSRSNVADASLNLATADQKHRWRSTEFVGSQACGKCHSDIAEAFSAHPMANTLTTVVDASPIEIVKGDLTQFEAQGRRYRVERQGDRMIHTEFMTDDAGKLVYEQEVDVQYAVGSGTNARTYLIDRGGILFESPITWYTEKRIWDLSPGYHENPMQRFNRRITDGCVQCHSGRPAPAGDGTAGRFEEQPFHELGIGCERCHGPGKQHIEQIESHDLKLDDVTADDMQIVNPARLDSRLEESVCYQCHMGGKRRILRKGKSYHDFQPGMATEDIWTVFIASTPVADNGPAKFISHVEQMQSSACFRGSEGRMRCTTCHDPHQSPKRNDKAAFYRKRCNSCHSDHGCSLPIEERESPPALNSCFHCHMPSSGSSDIPHTSASDHRVLRNPHKDRDVVDQSQQQLVWSIFDDSDQRMPQWEVQRARALALSEQAMEESDIRLMGQAAVALEAVLVNDADDVEVLSKLCFFYCDTRNYPKAIKSFEAALQADPYHEMSLKNLGMVALQTRSLDRGRRSFESYLKVNKWDGTIFGPYASVLANSGNLPAAVRAAERGLQLDPTQQKLRGFAVQLYGRIGDQRKSQEHSEMLREIGKRLGPWDRKRQERQRKELQDALQRNP